MIVWRIREKVSELIPWCISEHIKELIAVKYINTVKNFNVVP